MTALPRIAYLDGRRLRRSLLAACEHAQSQRRELNRINVFPVPDGDTGTNLALTVRAISDHLRGNRDPGVAGVAREAAEAAILGARGNCGMMLSHFLVGFADELDDRSRIGAREFADALRSGVSSLYDALERPVEGTILTVMRETAEAADEASAPDFVPLVDHVVERAQSALERTPDLLPVLREAGVVDAGAKGFVSLLEGVRMLIRGERLLFDGAGMSDECGGSGDEHVAGAVAAGIEGAGEVRYRFCTEALVRGDDLPGEARVRERLAGGGDSLIVLRSGRVLKVHVHTDDPEGVFAYLRGLGTLVTHKAEDMGAQHEAIERAAAAHVGLARRPVTVVTDSAADLPEEVVRAHGIRVTPLVLVTDERSYRDGIDVTAGDFHARLSEDGPLPTTSQPAPADFLQTFRGAAEEGEAILGVLLGSSLSGTYGAAEAAAARFDEVPVHLFDSRAATLLQGLLALKACEMAELGTDPAEIMAELTRVREQSGVLFTVDRFDRLLASGRVGRGRAFLGSMLQVKPILELDSGGEIKSVDRVLGRRRMVPAMIESMADRVPDDVERVRFGIVHVGAPDVIPTVSERLRRRYGPDVEILSAPAAPVIATHLGIGAWALVWMVED